MGNYHVIYKPGKDFRCTGRDPLPTCLVRHKNYEGVYKRKEIPEAIKYLRENVLRFIPIMGRQIDKFLNELGYI